MPTSGAVNGPNVVEVLPGTASLITCSSGAKLVVMPLNSTVTNTGTEVGASSGELRLIAALPAVRPVTVTMRSTWPGANVTVVGDTVRREGIEDCSVTTCSILSGLESVTKK